MQRLTGESTGENQIRIEMNLHVFIAQKRGTDSLSTWIRVDTNGHHRMGWIILDVGDG